MELVIAAGLDVVRPERLAGLAIERQRDEFSLVGGGEENTVPADHG
jgi:hypothetical protein